VTSTSATTSASGRFTSADAVAGYLAAFAIFLGTFEVLYRPFRLAPVGVVLALLATVMSDEDSNTRLIPAAWASVGIGFVVGAAVQVLAGHPLY
jgi:hypothetical protein